MKLRNKVIATLAASLLAVGGSLAIAPAAGAISGSKMCNKGTSTIYGLKHGSTTTYPLYAGNCAGNYITYIHIPANQCYKIQKSTFGYFTYCAHPKVYMRVQHTQATTWNVWRTK